MTHEAVASALREEYSPSPKSSHRLFLRHTILKKIEDFFHRTGAYVFAHIPRLGPSGRSAKKGQSLMKHISMNGHLVQRGFPGSILMGRAIGV